MSLNASLYIGATGLGTFATAMRVVSDNIANVHTTAFKSSGVRFGDMVSGYMPITTKDSDRMGAGVAILGTFANQEQGALSQTSSWSDCALDGEGFFNVAKFDNGQVTGKTMYTRDGSFHLNKDGYLVTNEGYAVLNNDGEPIRVYSNPQDPEYSDLYVETGGQIYGTRIKTATIASNVLTQPEVATLTDNVLTQNPGAGATASYDLLEDATSVIVRVLDKDGNLVRSDFLGPQAAGAETWAWDGKDGSGHAVAPGDYTFEVVTTPSAITSVTTPTLTNAETPGADNTVSYTLANDAYVTLTVRDAEGNVIRTVALPPEQAGAHSYTWDGLNDDGNEVPPGTYTTEVRSAPIAGGGDTAGYNLLVDADVSVKVLDAGGNLVRTISLGHQAAGSHTWNWNGLDADGVPLAAGDYTFQVSTSRDMAAEAISDARIHVTVFPNKDGLVRQGSNMLTPGSESGVPMEEGDTWEQVRGKIIDYSIESSNVDLAAEMVNMIIYQANYNANSKSVTTSSQMLDTVVNLVR